MPAMVGKLGPNVALLDVALAITIPQRPARRRHEQTKKMNRKSGEADESLACNCEEARLNAALLGIALATTNPQVKKKKMIGRWEEDVQRI